MNDYSIHVLNGKVIGNSVFYLLADDCFRKECRRLHDFTNNLDKMPAEKKKNIAEYKCAKYRYAAVSLIHSIIYNNNECRTEFNLEKYHYLIQPFDEMFKEHSEYLSLYESASADEKPDYSLYYMALVFTDRELSSLNIKKQNVNDWEKVELEERIGGLQFAKECLNDAWQKRKGEVQ